MTSCSNPFGLRDHLHPPGSRLNPVAMLDIVLIALFFTLLTSRLPFPGETIELPVSQRAELSGLPVSAVLTVKSDNMLFFDGTILSQDEFGRRARAFLEREGLAGEEAVLLVKLQREADVQTFQDVLDLAHAAGFTRVQLAAESAAMAGRMPGTANP